MAAKAGEEIKKMIKKNLIISRGLIGIFAGHMKEA
jgi:hypothetical protein